MCDSMVKKPQKSFVVKEERIRSLENLLDSYPDVLREPEERDQVMRSFRFRINAALIKLYEKKNYFFRMIDSRAPYGCTVGISA